MKKYLILIFLSSSLLAYGQANVAFEKKNFKDNVRGYKDAMDSIDAGDKFFQMGPSMYYMAVPCYMSAEKFNPDNDELNYKLGVCMVSRNYAFKTYALQYMLKAFKLNPAVAPDIHYQLGRAYHLNMQWEDAKREYNAYMQTLDPKKNADQLADSKKKIEECNNGEILVKNPDRVFIDNLGSTVNTQYPEYGVIISADESEMIFTAKRPNTVGGQIDQMDGQYMED